MDVPLPQILVSVQTDLTHEPADLPDPEWFVAAVQHGLAQVLAPDAAGQVSLLLTDDMTIRDLNHRYRGLDETTDVLSFSAERSGHWEGDVIPSSHAGAHDDDNGLAVAFPIPDNEPPPLGDVAVSIPQAVRQAEQQGVPLRRELALLLVHGALHLLGYDHYDDGERAEMQALERSALAAILGDSRD